MSGYSQVGSKSLRQLNRDNAAQHGTHSDAMVAIDAIERDPAKVREIRAKIKELDKEYRRLNDKITTGPRGAEGPDSLFKELNRIDAKVVKLQESIGEYSDE